MPKAEAMRVDEPKDVKRVAAAEGVGNAKPDAGEPIEMANTAGPAKLADMPFFEMLAAMKPRDWEDRIVYLYRQDKNIIKADSKDSNYIERITHPFEEAYVKEKHGGGRFLAILKNTRINGAERKFSFQIEGPPIIHQDEISVARNKADAAGTKSEIGMLLEQMTQMVDRVVNMAREKGGSEQDAVTKAVDTMKRVTDSVMEVQKNAFEKQLSSTTGNAMTDKLMEATIARLTNPAAEKDPLDQITKILAVTEKMRGGDSQKPGLLGIVSELKGLAEVAKELGIKIGSGGEGGAVEGSMDWKAALAANVPTALSVVGGWFDRWMQSNAERNRLMAAQLSALQRGAMPPNALPPAPQTYAPQPPATQVATIQPPVSPLPANFAGAAPSQQETPPAEVIEFPAQQKVQVDLAFVAGLVRRCFDKGDPGDAAALVLKRLFADDIEQFMPFFNDVEQLKIYAGMDPQLAQILPEPDFAPFLTEFVEEMKRNEDAEPEPGAGA